MKVAFQGEHGAFSELAAIQSFGSNIKTVPCENFADIFKAVEEKSADYGIVPIENSLEGSVGQNYDLLVKSDLKLRSEIVLRVVHCLIGLPNANLSDIKTVYSHPQALGQCRKFIEQKHLRQVPVYDTAGSVKIVKEQGKISSAGIASELAAKIYNMKILKKGIETSPNNSTRFLILSRSAVPRTGDDKTSLFFILKHEPGSLYRALRVFANKNINLTKLESRPAEGAKWEYRFYIDLEGHASDEKMREAIEELKEQAITVRVLGSYPKAGVSIPKPTLKINKKPVRKIAIIGAYGNMGKWFCKFFLSEGFEVIASGRNKEKLNELAKALPVKLAKSNADAAKNADLVIVSTLLKDFEAVINEISPSLGSGQVIIDVTSAKQVPVRIMHNCIKGATVLGTHPLFGPGATDTNQDFILTPTYKEEREFAEVLSKWLNSRGFIVSILSPLKHDELMSVALCLSHFIGIATGETWVSSRRMSELKKISPTSFKRLLGLVENIADSDPKFYANLQAILPGVEDVEDEFVKNTIQLLKFVKDKDEEGFANSMINLRKRLNERGNTKSR